jgi:5-methylthioadenosine/S-adenosylhomocysteine deaminase
MIYAAQYVLPGVAHHLEQAGIRVEEGRIDAVDTLENLRVAYPFDEVEDFGLAALVPGFVNGHSHLEYSLMNGIVEDLPYAAWKGAVVERARLLSEEDLQDAAFIGALDAIKAGITTTADVTASGASLKACLTTGMHGVMYREVSCATKEGVEREMGAALEDVGRWRELAKPAGTGMQIGLAPNSLYATHPEILKAIGEVAQDGTPVCVHMAGSQEECDFIRYGSSPFALAAHGPTAEAYEGIQSQAFLPMGVSPVRYALNWGILYAPNVCAVHCIHVNDDDIARLRENEIRVVACPRSNAKLGNGASNLVRLRQAGLCVGLGTNSPAAADSIDMLEEMRFSLLLERASAGYLKRHVFLKARDALRMGTAESARAIGMQQEVGGLAAGLRADFCVIDLTRSHQVPTHTPSASVVHTTNRHDVRATFIDGKRVFDRATGFNVPLDLEYLSRRAIEIRRKLRGPQEGEGSEAW